jgi:glucose uptake protein
MENIGLVLLFIGGVILTAGDIIMKKWVQNDSIYLYVLGLAIYMVGLNFLAYSFKFKNIAVASIIFVIFNVLTLTVVSWLYFKEGLSAMQIGGILLGIAAVVMLEFSK